MIFQLWYHKTLNFLLYQIFLRTAKRETNRRIRLLNKGLFKRILIFLSGSKMVCHHSFNHKIWRTIQSLPPSEKELALLCFFLNMSKIFNVNNHLSSTNCGHTLYKRSFNASKRGGAHWIRNVVQLINHIALQLLIITLVKKLAVPGNVAPTNSVNYFRVTSTSF